MGDPCRPQTEHSGRSLIPGRSCGPVARHRQSRGPRRDSEEVRAADRGRARPDQSPSRIQLVHSALVSGARTCQPYALHHHENFDGTGYPAGLKGSDIPLVARIVSVIDAYDAMVSNRCYRKGLSHEEAVRRLQGGCGTQFDPEVVQVFIPIAAQEVAQVFAAAGTSTSAAL